MTTPAEQQKLEQTKEQVKAVIQLLALVAEIIQTVGRIPNGHLYATLMAKGISYDFYCGMIQKLKDTKLIREENHLLIWIGPAKEVK